LRCGAGLEEEGDYAEYSFNLNFRDAQPISDLVQAWHRDQRLVQLPADQQQGVFFAMLLDYGGPSLLTAGGPTSKSGRMAGYLMIVKDFFRIWGSVKDCVDKLRDEV